MKLQGSRILLVGATGGIGRELSRRLLREDARLCLTGLTEEELEELHRSLENEPGEFFTLRADVTNATDRKRCLAAMEEKLGGIDILLNLAGINAFVPFDLQDPGQIERIVQVNLLAPMLMAHTVLPPMLEAGRGLIVNVGSTFGSIGYPCFTAYSASKFALRGFSQALRRELAGYGVGVVYIAPRAVKTPMNPPEVYAVARRVGMRFDAPETVAEKIVEAIRKEQKECYIGFPESFFVRINALAPAMVDSSLNRQNRVLREYATPPATTK